MNRNITAVWPEAPDLVSAPREGLALHVMLWSQSQNALHVEPLARMLRMNRRAYTEDRGMDYVPLFIGSDDQCFELARSVGGTIRTRDEVRALIGRGAI